MSGKNQLVSHGSPMIIGVGGGSGSGKTLLTQLLCKALGAEQSAVLSLDAYYRNRQDIPEALQGNYDHPLVLDQQLIFEHLQQLRQGTGVYSPSYDFVQHRRKAVTEYVSPCPSICYHAKMLYACMIYKVFVGRTDSSHD